MYKNPEEIVNNDLYQVIVCTTLTPIPFSLAYHSWFVINRKGKLSRWEVLFQNHLPGDKWGHLYKDRQAPFKGIEKYWLSEKKFWKTRILGFIEGDDNSNLLEIIEFIENSPKKYPYTHRYRFMGPNSNTYMQWVLDRFPEIKVKLPCNSLGKGFEI